MNVKSLIHNASILDDISAWEFLTPHLQDTYHFGLWNFASKIATRLQKYGFLTEFYTLFLKDNPDNVTIKFKLLDSLLKTGQYKRFVNSLQYIQTENTLSEELIEKIYARFAGHISKEFSKFIDEEIIFLLYSIKNLRKTYNTPFIQKIFNGFIRNILAKNYNDKENFVFLKRCLPFTNQYHAKQLITIASDFIKYNSLSEASILLEKISVLVPFSVGAFKYAGILSHKNTDYHFIVTSWLNFLSEHSKTQSQILAYALCLMQCEKFLEAYHVLKKAHFLYPNSEDIIIHYSETLFWMDRFDEMEAFITLQKHKIEKLKPKIFQLEAQIALATYNILRLKEIIKNATENNLSKDYIMKILLALGEVESAYALYHSSEVIEELYTIFPDKKFPFHVLKENPTRPLKGTLVILSSILGLGDEIRFSCFFPALSRICTNVKMICDERLYNLRRKQFKNISFISLDNANHNLEHPLAQSKYFTKTFNNNIYQAVQDADYVAVIPQFLEPLLENKTTSLKSQQFFKPRFSFINHWKKWLKTLPNKPKIGLFWRSDLYKYSHKKTNLKDWIEALKDLQIVIVPLQYSFTTEEKNLMADYPDLFFTAPVLDTRNDIESLAALIMELDYILTTAGATQNLAGALKLKGKVLMCTHSYEAYWRCDFVTKQELFAPNIEVIFGEPQTGLKGSISLVKEKLMQYITL